MTLFHLIAFVLLTASLAVQSVDAPQGGEAGCIVLSEDVRATLAAAVSTSPCGRGRSLSGVHCPQTPPSARTKLFEDGVEHAAFRQEKQGHAEAANLSDSWDLRKFVPRSLQWPGALMSLAPARPCGSMASAAVEMFFVDCIAQSVRLKC